MSFLKGKLGPFKHLSDETISRLISGELAAVHAFSARYHIDKCWQCRSRREAFERAAMQVTEHRNHLMERIPTNPDRREMLLADLRQRAAQGTSQPLWTRSLFNFQVWIGNRMSPLFASAAIIVTAALLLTMVWQRSASPLSVAQLLQRAVASDAAVSKGRPGVVYQKVRIVTSRLKVEHELYRDPRGIRHRRPEPVKEDAEPIREVLSKVDVEWDAPLSSSSFRDWHDRQASVSDEIHSEDGNLLTLVSKVPNSWIIEESLTVRASDFHPVARSIETRSYGTIEIAELSYAVLPWGGVNEALFEPLQPLEAPTHTNAILLPLLPSENDLDSAELSARLALSELHADQGEQINVTRADHIVKVKGVVETNERKNEIVRKLSPLQHVKTDILSIAELESLPHDRSTAQSVEMSSVDVSPSPLAVYLNTQGERKAEVGAASQRLIDAALSIRQSAGELTALQKRFSGVGESGPNRTMFTQLTQSYSERLIAGLDAETATLASLGFVNDSQPLSPEGNLSARIDRNDARCRELIAGGPGAARPASEIVTEIYASIAQIRATVTSSSEPAR